MIYSFMLKICDGSNIRGDEDMRLSAVIICCPTNISWAAISRITMDCGTFDHAVAYSGLMVNWVTMAI